MLSCLTFGLEDFTFDLSPPELSYGCGKRRLKFTQLTDTTLESAYIPRPHPHLMGEHGTRIPFVPRRRRTAKTTVGEANASAALSVGRTDGRMDGHLWREKQESAGKLVSRSTLLALSVSAPTEVQPTCRRFRAGESQFLPR